jgi:hypothetical protein
MPTPGEFGLGEVRGAGIGAGLAFTRRHLYCAFDFEPQDKQLELIVVVWGARRCGEGVEDV